jgi:hypothetical protein
MKFATHNKVKWNILFGLLNSMLDYVFLFVLLCECYYRNTDFCIFSLEEPYNICSYLLSSWSVKDYIVACYGFSVCLGRPGSVLPVGTQIRASFYCIPPSVLFHNLFAPIFNYFLISCHFSLFIFAHRSPAIAFFISALWMWSLCRLLCTLPGLNNVSVHASFPVSFYSTYSRKTT